jgi:23S rRNA (adenine2030-N6)-methyltransferase
MSVYLHSHHAGGAADVLKHAVLALLLHQLVRDPAPCCYIDTHAGRGRYDLDSAAALRKAEHREGIARLWPLAVVIPEARPYLAVVRALNPAASAGVTATPRHYPGSPCIAHRLLRASDTLVLNELNPDEATLLRAELAGDPRVSVRSLDAYRALPTLLHQGASRGLLLFDSPFERDDEFPRLTAALATARRLWPTGVLLAWYPLLAPLDRAPFPRELPAVTGCPVLAVELCACRHAPLGKMRGSGMAILNPPTGSTAALRRLLPWLLQMLAPEGPGTSRVERLVPGEAGD